MLPDEVILQVRSHARNVRRIAVDCDKPGVMPLENVMPEVSLHVGVL
jgi:hypothetical protein